MWSVGEPRVQESYRVLPWPLMAPPLADKSHDVLNKRESANVGLGGSSEGGWNGRLQARYARCANDDVLSGASTYIYPINLIWREFRGTVLPGWVETDSE